MHRQPVFTLLAVLGVFLFSACANKSVISSEAESIFYENDPSLKNRIRNLSSYAESTSWREVIRYHRFEIEPGFFMDFIGKHEFVNVSSLRPGKDVRSDPLAVLQAIPCDTQFVALRGDKKSYQSWWDTSTSRLDDITCYIVPPDRPHRQERLIYDKERGVAYLHK
jgi:hypothetical protein